MAGHSKWANIKHRKAAQDKKRAKVWTRIIKEITMAARDNGPDLDSNPALRLAVLNGKGANLAKDTIDRAIKKGSGAEAANLQRHTYEGYGPHGIAIFLDTTTENINRTVANIRSIFSKNNGSLGTNGSLSFIFDTKGVFEILNGNQTMLVLTRYLLEQYPETLSQKHFIGSTVVSSPIMSVLASHFGVECKLGLTGFKWIAKMIEDYPNQTFIAGGEESYGYMVGDQVRDKDAITSALLAAEIAAIQKSKGSSFYEYLIDSYIQHGLYHEELISLTKKGKAGFEEIQQMMHAYRTNPPKSIAGIAVEQVDHFDSQISRFADGTERSLAFPKSNVLRFILSDGSQIAIRPSGTEPKIKFYFSVNTKLKNAAAFDATKKKLADQCRKLTQSLGI